MLGVVSSPVNWKSSNPKGQGCPLFQRNCFHNLTLGCYSLVQEKGASSWLTALPIQEQGFSLHKTAFRDALAL